MQVDRVYRLMDWLSGGDLWSTVNHGQGRSGELTGAHVGRHYVAPKLTAATPKRRGDPNGPHRGLQWLRR
jgi:hypothetical protein